MIQIYIYIYVILIRYSFVNTVRLLQRAWSCSLCLSNSSSKALARRAHSASLACEVFLPLSTGQGVPFMAHGSEAKLKRCAAKMSDLSVLFKNQSFMRKEGFTKIARSCGRTWAARKICHGFGWFWTGSICVMSRYMSWYVRICLACLAASLASGPSASAIIARESSARSGSAGCASELPDCRF